MSNRADAIAPLLAVAAMAAGTYGYGELKTSMLRERYLTAIDLCAIAPATGAGRIAGLDRTYTMWWRDKLPEEVRAEARECILAARHETAKAARQVLRETNAEACPGCQGADGSR